jgi:flagellar biosynthesis chaperone FliJ
MMKSRVIFADALAKSRDELKQQVNVVSQSRDELQKQIATLAQVRSNLQGRINELTRSRDVALTDARNAWAQMQTLVTLQQRQAQELSRLPEQVVRSRRASGR